MQFDKDIQIPERPPGQPETRREILMRMEVGDSFRVEAAKMKKWSAAASRYGTDGRKFTVRKFEDAYRLWRTN